MGDVRGKRLLFKARPEVYGENVLVRVPQGVAFRSWGNFFPPQPVLRSSQCKSNWRPQAAKG